jgi:hypothetical protein
MFPLVLPLHSTSARHSSLPRWRSTRLLLRFLVQSSRVEICLSMKKSLFLPSTMCPRCWSLVSVSSSPAHLTLCPPPLSLQVRDKLTRFLMQSNSPSNTLNELETISGEIERTHRQTLLALQSAPPAPLSSPPLPPETVTLRDPSRLLASHLGLFPTVHLRRPFPPPDSLSSSGARSNQEAD